MILQSLVPGASVSAIALAAGVNANLLFKWRRDHLRAMRVPSATAITLVPVELTPSTETTATTTPTSLDGNVVKVENDQDDVIEVEIAGAPTARS